MVRYTNSRVSFTFTLFATGVGLGRIHMFSIGLDPQNWASVPSFRFLLTQEEPLKLDIRTIRSIAVVVVQLKLPNRLTGCLPIRNIYSFVMACRR